MVDVVVDVDVDVVVVVVVDVVFAVVAVYCGCIPGSHGPLFPHCPLSDGHVLHSPVKNQGYGFKNLWI